MVHIIHFPVDGIETSACVTKLSARSQNMFLVEFEDGYENIFFTDVETGEWIEEDLGKTSLALLIGSLLKPFLRTPVHVPKLLQWHRQVKNGAILCFGFFNFKKGKYKMYEIYNASKRYLYTLVEMNEEEWQLMGNTAPAFQNLDPAFIEQVILALPQTG